MKRIILLLIACFCSILAFTQTYLLEFNLIEGKTYKQNFYWETEMFQQYEAEAFEVKMIINGEISFFVEKIIDNHYEIKVSYNNLNINLITESGLSFIPIKKIMKKTKYLQIC
jgi:hypothetical protein